MSRVSEFLEEIDRRWVVLPSQQGKISLRIIGSAALMLQTGYERGTKDSDILETASVTPAVREALLKLGGQDTDLHKRHKMYVDIVALGLPFLPQVPLYHRLVELSDRLKQFVFEVLDVTDVVVSKLKRFNANDISDIRAMIDDGYVEHQRVIERFRAAVDIFGMDARADDLPNYVRNLNRIERDYFLVAESKIELPDWI